jgi:hypothetical protein
MIDGRNVRLWWKADLRWHLRPVAINSIKAPSASKLEDENSLKNCHAARDAKRDKVGATAGFIGEHPMHQHLPFGKSDQNRDGPCPSGQKPANVHGWMCKDHPLH